MCDNAAQIGATEQGPYRNAVVVSLLTPEVTFAEGIRRLCGLVS
ncbi:MAG TPA: hypothetical protein VNN72_25605 [Polyangiaceae bacterium]|nr:hypothetical protein [Polyangiaceae bacterium]